jgi:hypothetical protein
MRLSPSTRTAVGVLVAAGGFIAGTGPSLASDAAAQWIVVTPPGFREGLTPLIQHRQAQGFQIRMLQAAEGDATSLQTKLEELCRATKGKTYILLAGVFGRAGETNRSEPIVPGLRGVVGRMKGELTDAGYGLPGRDGTPEIAVGRFPARDQKELDAMVEKTLRFERDGQPAPWRNRLLLLVGNPGGGPLAEMFVAQTLAADLATLHPSWAVRTLFNAESSPYYLPRSQFRETGLRYIGEGDLFSIYLGHSYAAGLGLDGKFMTRADWERLSIPQGAGPFFTCGCFACQSDQKGDGYGLAAMRNPNGPVAVIGATGESYSAAGELAVEGLLVCLKQPPFPVRLGDYWLAVATGIAHGEMDETTFALLDMADGSGGKMPLASQRREHLEMWLLLGDPALRMPVVPTDISIQPPQAISPDKDIEIRGQLPVRLKDATVRLSLQRPLTSKPASQAEIPPNSSENRQAREQAFVARHQSANSLMLTTAETKAAGDHFTMSLKAPTDLPWSNVVIRATATASNEAAIGVISVPVRE